MKPKPTRAGFVGATCLALQRLARAPKSNEVARAIWTAMDDVRSGVDTEVPNHLRDAHSAAATGLGTGYRNPHDGPVEQEHLPAQTEGRPARRTPYLRGRDTGGQ